MLIQVSQIAVGTCYGTANKQQRRVWAIRAGKVYYFSRGGGHPWRPGHTLASPPSLKSFAAAVDAIIPFADLDCRRPQRLIPNRRRMFSPKWIKPSMSRSPKGRT